MVEGLSIECLSRKLLGFVNAVPISWHESLFGILGIMAGGPFMADCGVGTNVESAGHAEVSGGGGEAGV